MRLFSNPSGNFSSRLLALASWLLFVPFVVFLATSSFSWAACGPGGICITVPPPNIGGVREVGPRHSGGEGGSGSRSSEPRQPSPEERAQSLMATGNQYYGQENWAEALRFYNEALRLIGGGQLRRKITGNWYAASAMNAFEDGNYQLSIQQMNRAIAAFNWWDRLFEDNQKTFSGRQRWVDTLQLLIATRGERRTQSCMWLGYRIPTINGVCVYQCDVTGKTLLSERSDGVCADLIPDAAVPIRRGPLRRGDPMGPDEPQPPEDDNSRSH